MKLKLNERCPIHKRYGCCSREMFSPLAPKSKSKWGTVRPGVRRIKDEHADHPDGYRYKLSSAEMKKVLIAKIIAQNGFCSICGELLTDFGDTVPDHKLPKGAGGGRRDDRPKNIGAAHSLCNIEKGSKRL